MSAVNRIASGYKQTEVGVIPEDWEVPKVEAIARVVDSLHQTPSFSADGYPMVRVTDIKTGNLNLGEALKVSEPVFREFIKNYAPKKNDIVLSRVGSYGVSSFVETDEPFCMGQNTVVIEPNVPARYLYYVLNSLCTKQQIDNGSYGSGYKSLSLKNIKELLVPLPPSPTEQRAIATALSDVDALLAAQDKLIAKKRDIKQAAMQQLLTGKQRLPGFSGEWEVKTIEELEKTGIVKLSRGKVISKKDIENTAGDNPIYSSSVKNDGLFGCYGGYMFDEEMITWSVDGGGHFFHRIKHKFSVTNVCGFMRVDTSKLGYRFLAAQLQLLHSKLKFDYQDKAHPSIIRKAYSVLIPSMTEQTAIAAVLSDMDADLTALEQQRDKTRALKQGMMQELLTGRIRLV